MKHLIYIVHGFILLLCNVMAVMAFLFVIAFTVAHLLFIAVPIYFYFTGHTILGFISVTITLLFVFWINGLNASSKDKKVHSTTRSLVHIGILIILKNFTNL